MVGGGDDSVVLVEGDGCSVVVGGGVGGVALVLLIGSGGSVAVRFAVAGTAGHPTGGGTAVEKGLVL